MAKGTLKPSTLSIELLSQQRELEDSVGPYRKSLLWLVSRALESNHKTPILGLEDLYHQPASAETWHREEVGCARDWQDAWSAAGGQLNILSDPQVSAGTLARPIAAAHGCFDNAEAVMTRTLARIAGAPLAQTLDWLEY
jgi:hypothetical protein